MIPDENGSAIIGLRSNARATLTFLKLNMTFVLQFHYFGYILTSW